MCCPERYNGLSWVVYDITNVGVTLYCGEDMTICYWGEGDGAF